MLTKANFNSKVVRLKVTGNPLYQNIPIFQFQCGSIKSPASTGSACLAANFNSNVVRLKVEFKGLEVGKANSFQFQCGSIKSLTKTVQNLQQ